MHLWKRRLVALGAVVASAVVLVSSADAREPRDRNPFPPPPTLSPDFTFPTFPPPPTMPPPTQPPSTSPPPTMPPPTQPPSTSPPPTMPPPTIPPATANRLDSEINMLIDDLEQLGDRFSDTINELRDLQNSF